MYTQWIENCVVQRVSVRDGRVLDLDDYNEIVISCPLLLTLPAVDRYPVEAVRIDPLKIATDERPLLNLAGAVCTQAWSGDDWRATPEVLAWTQHRRRPRFRGNGMGVVRQAPRLHGMPTPGAGTRGSPRPPRQRRRQHRQQRRTTVGGVGATDALNATADGDGSTSAAMRGSD